MSVLTDFLTEIADAIRSKKGTTGQIPAANFASEIASISTGVEALVANDESISPSGTYANSTYYNTSYGVKIGYMRNGDIILSMQGGTSTAYEGLYFSLGTVPSGVTITEEHNTSSSYASAKAGLIYACVLHGITQKVNISVTMSYRNATVDYTKCEINITAV